MYGGFATYAHSDKIMLTKPFMQKHYDESDTMGKGWAKEVSSFYGWICLDDQEKFSKTDLVFGKNERVKKVEVEVRTDSKDNFAKIGKQWNSIHVPCRKGKVAKEKNQLANLFMSFSKDGRFFWSIDMNYAITFPEMQFTCGKDESEWEDTLHDVKIDKKHTLKYEIIRSEEGKIVEIKKILDFKQE